ncbi:MAG: tetratricopeptide repeat protein [Gammaproteobacteria bacterium AqS3]|nr:tetratricopeptide repeat protein [Gammaproteobacteria bacterium AqS3]
MDLKSAPASPLGENLKFNLSALRARTYRLYSENKQAETLEACKQLLKHNPSDPDANHIMAVLLTNSRQYIEAHQYIRRAMLTTHNAQYFNTLGVCLQNLGDITQAEFAFRRAMELDTAMVEPLRNLAEMYLNIGFYDQVISQLEETELLPREPSLRSILARAYYHLGRYEDALPLLDALLREHPELLDTLTAKIMLTASMGDEEGAWQLSRELLKRGVNGFTSFLIQATLAHEITGEQERAYNLVNQAKMMRRESSADLMLAQIQLALGDFKSGWAKYSVRQHSMEYQISRPQLAQDHWDGNPRVGAIRMAVHCRENLSEVIPFLRFLPQITDRIERFSLTCTKRDVNLLATAEGPRVVDHYDVYGKYPTQLQTPLDLLPATLKADSLPEIEFPYLNPLCGRLPEKSGLEKRRTKRSRKRVGIVWAPEKLQAANHRTRIPFEALSPLLGALGIQIYSLQTGEFAEQISAADADTQVIDLGEHVEQSSANLARVIDSLDLLICSDSPAAHIAGAIGKTAWVILPRGAHWIWGVEETSQWYPSLRLFRQKTAGRWDGVIQDAAVALREFTGSEEQQ